MKKTYLLSLVLFCLFDFVQLDAQARGDCLSGTESTLLNINNVSTELGPGGTFWPNGYIVPQSAPIDVHAIFTGGLWVGGFDPAGNLKLAAQTYRSNLTGDYFPGPLDPMMGNTEMEICENWDRVFRVRQSEIDDFLDDLADNGMIDGTHLSILGWPARGNPSFSEIHSFDLPDQDLAPFFDANHDGLYNPNDGDYPGIKGEEALWWVINDAGGIHTMSQASPLQFEIQVMAFASSSEDPAIDNTTFYDLKIFNRAIESIDSTFISLWIDADLGCPSDDMAGSSPANDLAFVYNADALDGDDGCTCPQGINTYCEEIPILGIKILKSPIQPNGEPSGMTSFGIYNNASEGSHPPGTTDPNTAVGFYRLMSGFWPDGSPFTNNGEGYMDGNPTAYLFPGNPSDTEDWSMCSAGVGGKDIRMVISTGNVRMDPGEVTNLSFAVTLVEAIAHPCPDITPVIEATDIIEEYYSGLVTATEDINGQHAKISIFPNPARESIQLNLQADGEELDQLWLFDAQGKNIRTFSQLSGQQFELQRLSLRTGIYFYKVRTSQGKMASGKLIYN